MKLVLEEVSHVNYGTIIILMLNGSVIRTYEKYSGYGGYPASGSTIVH